MKRWRRVQLVDEMVIRMLLLNLRGEHKISIHFIRCLSKEVVKEGRGRLSSIRATSRSGRMRGVRDLFAKYIGEGGRGRRET